MGRVLLAFLMVIGCGSNKPSDEAVADYHAAQRAALARVRTVETAMAASLRELQANKWVARPDLGSCTSKLPKPRPKAKHEDYPSWFLRYQDDAVGWDRLADRVFEQTRQAIGDPDSAYVPDADEIAARMTQVKQVRVAESDILIVRIDAERDAKIDGGNTFEPGFQRGRAWVWSPERSTIVCAAAAFAATTPDNVEATVYKEDYRQTDKSVALTLALGRASTSAAFDALVAAGPPK